MTTPSPSRDRVTTAEGPSRPPGGNLTLAAPINPSPAPAVPPQGIFTSCDVSVSLTACEARLPVVARAGFKLVVQELPPVGPALLDYLAALKASGLQAMWEMTDPGWWGYNGSAPFGYDPGAASMLAAYPSWAAACACQTNGDLLTFMARAVASAGVTFGFYLADDSQLEGAPQPYQLGDALSGLKRLSDDLHAAVPGTTTMISTYGMNGGGLAARASASADLIGQELYPFASYAGVAVPDATAVSDVTRAARLAQTSADAQGAPPVFILQAFSWGECATDAAASGADPASGYPDATEMSSLRDTALSAAHPSVLLWYSLEETIGWPAGQQPPGCAAPPDPGVRLAALTDAVTAPYPPPTGR